MEVFVFFLGILLGSAFGEIWVWATNKWCVKPFINDYHFHHSLFAILLFTISLFTQQIITVILVGSGLGIIIQHTYREGFKFITKR